MNPIPSHLSRYPWYAPHQAWLREQGYGPAHDPGDAPPQRVTLTWANLTWATLTGANLTWATLTDANLAGVNLAGASLTWADLAGANLTWATLTKATLAGANLAGATLAGANLVDADLTDATGLPSAPVVPDIDRAIVAALSSGGSLRMEQWHTCDTTHCRAGWAVVLAGKAGRKLERKTSPYLAGRLIYEASRPGIPCPDFFATDEEALADLKRCAGMDDDRA